MSAASPWRATVLTLYPEMFPGPLGTSLSGRALGENIWSLETRDIRASATSRHRNVDDTPAGGGPGMVMRADIVAAAIDAAVPEPDGRPRLLMSPRGRPLDQARVRRLAEGPGALILCGRFEGVDERVIEARGLEEVSIGDYVLSGGELGAMVLIDAVVRLLPGVMGAERLRRGGELRGRAARISALHPPARMGGARDPRDPALRRPCGDRQMAPRRSRADHARAASGPALRPAAGALKPRRGAASA